MFFDTLLASWPIFKTTNKTHYAQLCLYVQFVTTQVHPSMYKQIILMFTNIFKAIRTAIAHRMINVHGIPDHHIPPDKLTEIQNLYGR